MNAECSKPKRSKIFSVIILFLFLGCVAAFSYFMTDSVKLDVDYINQLKDYPTGCESVSAVMSLNYAGIDISVDDFIDDYLPKGDAPHKNKKGKRVGDDPYEVFLGNPYSDSGYGCFAPVIETAIDSLLEDRQLNDSYDAIGLEGLSVRQLCSKYIKSGTPVIFWASSGMSEVSESITWKINGTDKSFTWKKPMHCLLLVGYDFSSYYFNDPQTDKLYKYGKKEVEAAYKAMGSQVVVVIKK